MAEETFSKLQNRFGPTLAGTNSSDTLEEALKIANRVTEDEIKETLPRDEESGDILDPIREEKKNRKGEVVREKVTVEDFIKQQQQREILMAKIISSFIREQIDPTPTEPE